MGRKVAEGPSTQARNARARHYNGTNGKKLTSDDSAIPIPDVEITLADTVTEAQTPDGATDTVDGDAPSSNAQPNSDVRASDSQLGEAQAKDAQPPTALHTNSRRSDVRPATAKPTSAPHANVQSANVPHPAVQLAKARPAEAQPAEAQPAEARPAEARPEETQPAKAQHAEAQPAEAQPAEAQPAEAKPAGAQPAEAQRAEAKPVEEQTLNAQPANVLPANPPLVNAQPANLRPSNSPFANPPPSNALATATQPFMIQLRTPQRTHAQSTNAQLTNTHPAIGHRKDSQLTGSQPAGQRTSDPKQTDEGPTNGQGEKEVIDVRAVEEPATPVVEGECPPEVSDEEDIATEDLLAIRQVAETLMRGARPHQVAPASVLERLRVVARKRIPRTVPEAVYIIEVCGASIALYKKLLKLLKILHATVLRSKVLREIVASKMVQRRISFGTILECLEDFDVENPPLANDQHRRLRSLPPTGVKGRNHNLPQHKLYWQEGDLPRYDSEGNIIPGQPPLHGRGRPRGELRLEGVIPLEPEAMPPVEALSLPEFVAVEPAEDEVDAEANALAEFEPAEYCRLLHVLADKSLSPYLNQLKDPKLRERPWVRFVAPLFNDRRFKPFPVRSLSGGVSKTDIAGLIPTFVRERDGETLQHKFAEFKSLYRAAVRGYVEWGDDEMDSFSDFCQGQQYVMYAFCLLENYPELEPLTLQAPSEENDESQPNGGIEGLQSTPPKKRKNAPPRDDADDDSGELAATSVPKRVRAAMLQDNERAELKKIIEGGVPGEVVADDGLGGLSSAPVPGLTKSELIQQMERAEREKANLERMMNGKLADGVDGRQGPGLIIAHPRSAALEEIECYAREKAILEVRNARVQYTTSLLTAIKEAEHSVATTKNNEKRRLYIDVLNDLHQRLSQNTTRDVG